MKLPLTEIPSSTVVLPVLKKEVRVRAMNIKEEKILLTAKDAGDKKDVMFSISELVKACTYDELDFNTLSIADIVAIFIMILKLSKGTTAVHSYICHNEINENGKSKECGNVFTVDVNLDDIVFKGGDIKPVIELNNGIVLNMRYPTPSIYEKATNDAIKVHEDGRKELDEAEMYLRAYAYCIKSIIKGNDVYSEFTDDEIYEWFISMNENTLEKIIPFFESLPIAELTYEVKCPKCGHSETVTLRGLDSFFTQDMSESRL